MMRPPDARLSLPGPEELTGEAIVRRLGACDGVRVEQLGHSRTGRPIPLITVGEGSLSALVVGAPHPNEPTGCLSILRMLEQLASGAAGSHTDGWQWHFIPAIDIDGIALNDGWFSDTPDLEAYLRHLYRPPFRLQPEYSFPLDLPNYRFSAATPENECWRRALEITEPQLQCSMHGADSGGSFFILSEASPILAAELVRLPAEFGISLNTVGEPFAEMTTFQPGVFSFPSVAAIATAGAGSEIAWRAGDSSAGFAGERFGTFSMTCEVPLWRDAREDDARPSGRTMGDVIDERIESLLEDAEMLTACLPSVRRRFESFEARALFESLEDGLAENAGVVSALRAVRPRGAGDRALPVRDLVVAEAGMHGLRTPAMLLRLAKLTQTRTAELSARSVLERRLTAFQSSTQLLPVPLAQATGLHVASVYRAAEFLRHSR